MAYRPNASTMSPITIVAIARKPTRRAHTAIVQWRLPCNPIGSSMPGTVGRNRAEGKGPWSWVGPSGAERDEAVRNGDESFSIPIVRIGPGPPCLPPGDDIPARTAGWSAHPPDRSGLGPPDGRVPLHPQPDECPSTDGDGAYLVDALVSPRLSAALPFARGEHLPATPGLRIATFGHPASYLSDYDTARAPSGLIGERVRGPGDRAVLFSGRRGGAGYPAAGRDPRGAPAPAAPPGPPARRRRWRRARRPPGRCHRWR